VIQIDAQVYQLGLNQGLLNLSLATLLLEVGSAFTYSTGSETIPLPDRGKPTGNTSYTQFTTPSNLAITATPVIATPNGDGLVKVLTNVGSFSATYTASGGGQLSLSALDLADAQQTLFPGDTLVVYSAGTRWRQLGPVVRMYRGIGAHASSAGDDGLGATRTTDATPTVIYTTLVSLGLDAIGFTFDVIANNSTTDSATWLGGTMHLDSSGNIVGTLNKGTVTKTGGATAWDISISTPASNLVNFLVTGAAATNIDWRWKVRQITGSSA
jgi:hypothetical protein